MKKEAPVLSLLIILVIAAGCGGAAFKAGKPWDPEEATFFDDGVDVVEDLTALSGKWAYDLEKDLDGRVQLADLVAKVEVVSVQTASDLDGETGKRVEVRIKDIVYGASPSLEIFLESPKEDPGHQLILRYENRLKGSFFLFVRWFVDGDGSLGHHFHLSPDSMQMESEIKKRVDARQREEQKEAPTASRSM